MVWFGWVYFLWIPTISANPQPPPQLESSSLTRSGEILEILSEISIPTKSKTAGIYFPDNLYAGIDDRQIFLVASTLQKIGYSIDIIVTDQNPCQTIEELRSVRALSWTSLDDTKIRFIRVNTPQRILSSSFNYNVFVANGLEKIPPVDGIGKQLNIFVCKFPMDGFQEFSDPYVRWSRLKSLSSYDFILVDYPFTYELLVKTLLQTSLKELTRHQRTYPSIYVLPPPALTVLSSSQATTQPRDSSVSIQVIVTSPDPSPQSQCQRYLDLLPFLQHSRQKLSQETDESIQFQLILTMNSKQEETLCRASLNSLLVRLSFPLTVLSKHNLTHSHPHPSQSEICWVIPWDNTLSNLNLDRLSDCSFPTSSTANRPQLWKTFPPLALDLMLRGSIPIFFSDSTTRSLVTHSLHGFLVTSLKEYLTTSLTILHSSQPSRAAWSHAATERASYFKANRYSNTLKLLMRKYIKSRSFRQFTWTALPILRRKTMLKASSKLDYVSVIVEPHLVNTFEYCVKNVVMFTGLSSTLPPPTSQQVDEKTQTKAREKSQAPLYDQQWGLHVYHSPGNELFVKFILRSIPNVVFHLLPYDLLHATSSNSPNMIQTSPVFWNSFLETKRLLLFDSHTLLLQGSLSQFLRYDLLIPPLPPALAPPALLSDCLSPPPLPSSPASASVSAAHSKRCREGAGGGGVVGEEGGGSRVKREIYEFYRSISLSLSSPVLMKSLLDHCSASVSVASPSLTNLSLPLSLSADQYLLYCLQNYQHLSTLPLLTLPENDSVFDRFCRITPLALAEQDFSHESLQGNLPFAIQRNWESLSSYESLLYYKASLQTLISCC
jgi:hypothetical protein